MSLGNSRCTSFSKPKDRDPAHSLVNDDIEKRVHVNKDGSLSVEMKVRFRLLNDETLKWSTQIKKSSALSKKKGEQLSLCEEEDRLECMQTMNREAFSETDDSFYPCDADSYSSKLNEACDEEMYCHNCGKQCPEYDIWKNPMHASQQGMMNAWQTRSSCSSASSHRRVMCKQKTSIDSIRTMSSEEYTEHFVQQSSCYSKVVEKGDSRVEVEDCTVNQCRTQSGLSTDTSSIRGQQERSWVNGDRNTRESLASVASNSTTQNNLEAQSSVELINQMSDSKHTAISFDWAEPSPTYESKSVSNVTDHDRRVSYISESSVSSQKSKSNMCRKYSAHSRSLSSIQRFCKADTKASAGGQPSANSISSSTSREDYDCDKHSSMKTGSSSMSIHSCSNTELDGPGEETRDDECTLTSVSSRALLSESERWSTEGSTHSKSHKKYRDMRHNEHDAVCSCELSEGPKRRQSEIQAPSSESTPKKVNLAILAEAFRSTAESMEDLCKNKEDSQDSSWQHSEPVSVSGASSPSNSKGNQSLQSGGSSCKQHGTRTKFTSVSNLSVSHVKDLHENMDVTCEPLVSQPSSIPESSVSKYNCASNPGIERLQSSSSRGSSSSEIKNEAPAAEAGSMSEDTLSKSSIAHSSEEGKRKHKTCYLEAEHCSRALDPETYSLPVTHCPSPPKGKPNYKKTRPAKLKHSSTSSMHSDSVHNVDNKRGPPDNSRPSTSGSKSIISKGNPDIDKSMATTGKDNGSTDQHVINSRRKSSTSSFRKKAQLELGEASGMVVEGNGIMPSALPNISAEEVVHEWLKNIPSETMVIEYEEEPESTETASSNTLNYDTCQAAASAERVFGEEAIIKNNNRGLMMEGTLCLETGTTDGENRPKTEEIRAQEKDSDCLLEGMESNQDENSPTAHVASSNSSKNALPSTVHASVQIMKALFMSPYESKFDRSNSLPEVSPTMGRKLSNSAKVLITCLTGLKLIDEETSHQKDKSGDFNNNRYIELLNIFQSLWLEGSVDADGPKVDKLTKDKTKMTSDLLKNYSSEADLTPVSSSGVDVNSGSGGSGEGSMAGTGDSTLTPEKTSECKAPFPVTSTENSIAPHTDSELTTSGEQDEKGHCCRLSSSSSKYNATEEIICKGNSSRANSPSIVADIIIQSEKRCSDCETCLSDMDENMNKRNLEDSNSKMDEADREKDTSAPSDQEENVNNEKEEPIAITRSDESTCNTEKSGSNDEKELDRNVSQSQDTTGTNSQSDCQSTVYFVSESNENNESFVNKQSFITDPVWVLKLLKKIESQFMTHYVDAMNEFKIRWNLEDNENLDEMIAELKSEVGNRIEKSVENELRKIRSRAGRKVPRPPEEMSRQRPTQVTEQRRKRLKTMRKKSAFNELIMGQDRQTGSNDISLETDEEDLTFSASLADDTSADGEYCPCETCIRKKLALKSFKPTTVAANAPIVRAFDLREILRMKKEPNEVKAAISPCSLGKECQDSSAMKNEVVDDTVDETNPASPDSLSDPGTDKNMTRENSEQDNEISVENETQEHQDKQTVTHDLHSDEDGAEPNNEKGEEGKDQDQEEEETTVSEKGEAEETKSEHERGHETSDDPAGHQEDGDDYKEDTEGSDTAEQIAEEGNAEGGNCTDPCVENQGDEKENGADEPEGRSDGDSELSIVGDKNEETVLAESEENVHVIENTDFESDHHNDAEGSKNETSEPVTALLDENEGNEEKEILTEIAAFSCDSSSHNDGHQPNEGTADGIDVVATQDTDGVPAEDMDGDAAGDIDGGLEEDMDGVTAGDMDRGTMEEKNDGPAEDTDGDTAEEVEEGAAEEVDGGPAEEMEGSPKEELDGGTPEEVDGGPAEETDGSPGEGVDGGTSKQVDGGQAEEIDSSPSEDIYGGTVEEVDVGPEEETHVSAAEELVGGTAEDTEEGTAEDVEGGTVEDMDGGTENDMEGGTAEDMEGGTAEDTEGGTAEEMEGGKEGGTNVECKDLDTANGNSDYRDSDNSDSKPAQMYPDSSSEEEDKASLCASPVATNNCYSSLKKAEKLYDHNIELDDLDF